MSTISTTLVAVTDESGRVRIDSTLFHQSCYLEAHLQLGQGRSQLLVAASQRLCGLETSAFDAQRRLRSRQARPLGLVKSCQRALYGVGEHSRPE